MAVSEPVSEQLRVLNTGVSGGVNKNGKKGINIDSLVNVANFVKTTKLERKNHC